VFADSWGAASFTRALRLTGFTSGAGITSGTSRLLRGLAGIATAGVDAAGVMRLTRTLAAAAVGLAAIHAHLARLRILAGSVLSAGSIGGTVAIGRVRRNVEGSRETLPGKRARCGHPGRRRRPCAVGPSAGADRCSAFRGCAVRPVGRGSQFRWPGRWVVCDRRDPPLCGSYDSGAHSFRTTRSSHSCHRLRGTICPRMQ
jgi:hypothetical protein